MAVQTVPASGGVYTNLSSDAANFSPGCYRVLGRFLYPSGLKTERVTVDGTTLKYKGHPIRLIHYTLSGGACFPTSQANADQIVKELKDRGVNCVRLHHIDQKAAAGGILKDSPTTNWYEQDATQQSRFITLIKAIRTAGMWYSLDFNSLKGNDATTNRLDGADANAIVGSNITKVTTGATSAVQAVDSTTGLVAGMKLWFGSAAAEGEIQSVDSPTQITLTGSMTTITDETCYPLISRFKQLYAINAAARTQIHAHASNLFALDVSVGAEAGVTIAADPHNLYNTITNEFLPSTTHGFTVGKLMDAKYGYTWSESTAAHRTDYANDCITALATWRAYQASAGSSALVAWGSEFGTARTEYDDFRSQADVWCSHIYFPVLGGARSGLTAGKPSQQATSISNIFNSNTALPAGSADLPKILEECNSADPNRFKAECAPYTAIYCAKNNWAGWGQFDWADGTWAAGSIANVREYQVHTDRTRDATWTLGVVLYGRGDIYPTATATNLSGEDRTEKSWFVDTERTIALHGPETATKTFANRAAVITINDLSTSLSSTVFATSFDMSPLWSAKRILVGHVTDLQSRTRSWSDETFTNCTDIGNGTECLVHGTASLKIYHQRPSNLTMYRLNHAGARGATVSGSVSGNFVTFTLDNTSTDTLFYEIAETGTAA